MYKYIALDLDGTLLNSAKEITPETKQGLKKAQQSGHQVILISGRPYAGMIEIAQELELDKHQGYICSYNGGSIRCAQTEDVLYAENLTKREVEEIYQVTKEVDCMFMTYDDQDQVYAENVDEGIMHEIEINDLKFSHALRLDESPKVLLSASPQQTEANLPIITQKLGNDYNVVKSYKLFTEINPKNVHKGAALERLMTILDDQITNVIAFGDGGNDLTMIEQAGHGVAMGNAHEEIKEIANQVTLSNDEDGIIEVLKELAVI